MEWRRPSSGTRDSRGAALFCIASVSPARPESEPTAASLSPPPALPTSTPQQTQTFIASPLPFSPPHHLKDTQILAPQSQSNNYSLATATADSNTPTHPPDPFTTATMADGRYDPDHRYPDSQPQSSDPRIAQIQSVSLATIRTFLVSRLPPSALSVDACDHFDGERNAIAAPRPRNAPSSDRCIHGWAMTMTMTTTTTIPGQPGSSG